VYIAEAQDICLLSTNIKCNVIYKCKCKVCKESRLTKICKSNKNAIANANYLVRAEGQRYGNSWHV